MFYNHRMDMFVALASPTRRHILELLATSGELSATAIYEQFSVSPQAVSQHLKVLREAHLVEMENVHKSACTASIHRRCLNLKHGFSKCSRGGANVLTH